MNDFGFTYFIYFVLKIGRILRANAKIHFHTFRFVYFVTYLKTIINRIKSKTYFLSYELWFSKKQSCASEVFNSIIDGLVMAK